MRVETRKIHLLLNVSVFQDMDVSLALLLQNAIFGVQLHHMGL